MAIVGYHIETDISDVNASSYLTGSRSPTANRLQVVDVVLSDTNPVLAPTVTGCGLTWVHVTGVEYDTAGTRRGLHRFRALGASPTAGALTITATEAVSGCGWSWCEYDGVDTSGTNGSGAIVQTVTASGSGTALAATLAAFGSASNGVTVGLSTDDDSVFTAGTGYTILGQDVSASASPVCSIGQMWRANDDTTPDATIPVTAQWGMVASELKVAIVVAITYPREAPHYRVAFAFGVPSGTVPAAGDWTYLDRRIKSLEIVRGRNRETETMQPARCRLKLDDPNRDLEPNYVASPYYPDVVPMTPVKVECVFTTTAGASTTYPRFVGYVDDFMPLWNDQSEVVVSCTDAMAVLQMVVLRNPYVAAVMDDRPDAYYRFSETVATQPASDISGFGRAGTYSATGVTFSQVDPITDSADGAILLDGLAGSVVLPTSALPLNSAPFSIEVWFRVAAGPAYLFTAAMSSWQHFRFFVGTTGVMAVDGDGTGHAVSSAATFADNAWHQAVFTFDGTTGELFVDKVSRGTATFSFLRPWNSGGFGNVYSIAGFNAGSIDEGALFTSELSSARVTAHYDASNAWLGQTTGARVASVLAAAEWDWGQDLAAGLSTLQSAPDLEGTTALEHILTVTGRGGEGGSFFIDRTGQAVFRDRHWTLLNTTVAAVFGDAPGELRFASVEPESSNATIRNEWRGRRLGGPAQIASDQTSINRYMRRSESEISFVIQSDDEVGSRLRWYLDHYKDPLFTVRRMIVPASDANTIVPACLVLDLESRVTVRRRPRGGTLAEQQHLVQGWTEAWGTDTEAKWKMTFQLSPADTRSYWIWGVSRWNIDTRWGH